ncbi:MAG: hypothetical protein PHF70_09620 [Opitutales bacterium]|nr:hypothetical protein [Opitutales bacterium]
MQRPHGANDLYGWRIPRRDRMIVFLEALIFDKIIGTRFDLPLSPYQALAKRKRMPSPRKEFAAGPKSIE